MSERPVTIYALIDPRDDSVGYIGRTAQSLARRLAGHMSGRAGWAHDAWIKTLAEQGLRPRIVVLEVTDAEHADEAEGRHIREHLQRGVKLTNSTKRMAPQAAQVRPERMWKHALTLSPKQGQRVERLATAHAMAVPDLLGSLVMDGVRMYSAFVHAPALAKLREEQQRLGVALAALHAERDDLAGRIAVLEQALQRNESEQLRLMPP